jgi:sugar phosphate isomerase/epimerase
MGVLGPNDLIASYYTLTGAEPGQPSRFSFAERVAAAAAAGFAAIGCQPSDYTLCRAAGLSDADMTRILADHGIRVAELEFLFDWAHGGDRGAAARKLEEEFYRLADVFQPRHLNVGDLGVGGRLGPLDAVAERFAGVCDRAAQHGLLVAIEFLPWTPIPDAATAWAIARTAGRANGGLLVDAWHHFRGTADPAVLRAIPGHRIVAVQLDDADAKVVGDLVEDTSLRRRLPGEGSFDLVGFMKLLDAMGVQAPLSVEILSSAQWALPVTTAARAAFDATRAVLATARRPKG